MPPDKIILSGIRCRVNVGVQEEERAFKQLCSIDLELYCDLAAAGKSDDLAHSIDYAKAAALAAEYVESHSFRLLEAAAEAVAGLLLDRFPLERVVVRFKKLSPPMPQRLDYAAVELERRR